jgi:hypothetical protein
MHDESFLTMLQVTAQRRFSEGLAATEHLPFRLWNQSPTASLLLNNGGTS